MTSDDGRRFSVGIIGGIETFAGQAALEMRRHYPELAELVFFPDGAALFSGLAAHKVDAIVGAAAALAGPTELQRMLASPATAYYVIAEMPLPFKCALVAQRGASLHDIQQVFGGPASIDQAKEFLSRNLPAARAQAYTDPLATAAEIAAGDGRSAMIGTHALAERFDLKVLAARIDGGAINGNWWVLSWRAVLDSAPDRVIVTARLSDDGRLGQIIAALAACGFSVSTATATATGRELLESDYVLRFSGSGKLADVQTALAQWPQARLAGALNTRNRSL